MKTLFFLLLTFAVGYAFADEELIPKYKVFTNQMGCAIAYGIEKTPNPINPANEEYPLTYVFPTNAPQYWKKSGSDWISMTAQEISDKDNATKTAEADFDKWSKPELIAFIKVMLDEINILRSTLGLQPRTTAQLKTAIKNKL